MGNRNVIVLVNSASVFGTDFVTYIKPYIEHFGVPYEVMDISKTWNQSKIFESSLILAGHKDVFNNNYYGDVLDAVGKAISNGTGLVSFDNEMFDMDNGNFDSHKYYNQCIADSFNVIDNHHYITSLHERNEKISLFCGIRIEARSKLSNGQVVITAGEIPLLETGMYGKGDMVLWNDYSWMSHKVKGPVYGMDDLIWKSIVWASKKPFVMQGLPPFLTMRVDDVWGSDWNANAQDPLFWVGTCSKYNIKPWLGLFIDNMSEISIKSLKGYVDKGEATAFPHAFAGYQKSTRQQLQEHWIYFDHFGKCDYNDDVLKNNIALAEEWHVKNKIPMSKVALGHYYEIGKNALESIIKWGCEFIGIHMQPGEPFENSKPWLMAAPFRKSENGDRRGTRPVYYADYLSVKDAPEFDGKLFNCVVEIRDVSGYEWAPDNDVEDSVRRGIIHLKRSFDSMSLASLFTHESDFIQYIKPDNWDDILSGVCKGVERYKPIYVTFDEACRYIRASHNLKILHSRYERGNVILNLEGNTDISTKCYLFTQTQDGEIKSELREIPKINESAEIII